MPHIASSLWQPGRRGGGRRWVHVRKGGRKKRTTKSLLMPPPSKRSRRQRPTRTVATPPHSRRSRPQPQKVAQSARSRIATRRLPSVAEEEEEVGEEQVVGTEETKANEEEDVEAKVYSVAAAAPLQYNVRAAAPAMDWGVYFSARQTHNEYLRAAPPAAVYDSVAYSTAAAAATVPVAAAAAAAAAAVGAGEERVEKEPELEMVQEVEEDPIMAGEEQVAGSTEREEEGGEEVAVVEAQAEAASVAAPAARSSNVRGFGGAALATVWGAYRTVSRSFLGSVKTAPPPVNSSVAYSTAAAAATTPAAAPGAAAEATSACIDRGHERDGEGEEGREEKGEGNMGDSAGDTTLANLGNGAREFGSPVPAKFRPEGRKNDALCSWEQSFLHDVPGHNELGAGSFGIVLAVMTKGGEHMAMKIMARTNPTEERETKNEVDILEQCSAHPNVVDFYGFIRTPTRLCILMPKAFCDLAGMIKGAVVAEKHAVSIVRQLVSALEFVHGRGIVHRDIKPGNILISEKHVVLLADFGLAVTTDGTLLSGESACGTLPYMAPELIQRLPYGSAVDMWATGVVAFELLHRSRPFTGRYDGHVPHNGVDGSAGQSGSGNNSGGVSNTSGSIVTGYRERSGSMETPGGTSSQREVQRKILLGEYNLNTRLVGDKGGDFISKLLSRNPHERTTAVQAAEHTWIYDSSTGPRRRRKSRLTVALATIERAMSTAQHLKARVEPSSDLGRAAAKMSSTAVVEATAAAASAISTLDQLVVVLSDIKALGEKGQRSDKMEIAGKGDTGGNKDAAEEVVRTVEVFAREAEKPIAAATATVDSWEKAVRQAALA